MKTLSGEVFIFSNVQLAIQQKLSIFEEITLNKPSRFNL